MKIRELVAWALICASAFVSVGTVAARAAQNTLGVSIQVLLGPDDSSKSVNQNNRLWFVIEPGKSGTREIVVSSTSNIAQKVHLSVGARVQVNGQLNFDDTGTTPVNSWTSYSKNDFSLAPNAQEQVTMKISVPENSAVQVLQPALLVEASGLTSKSAQYKIPTEMRFVQGMFVGVGTADAMNTAFTIDDVVGSNGVNGHVLHVQLSNTGKTPIAVQGSIQLSNLTFKSPTVGPIEFSTGTISPGKSDYAEIKVGKAVPEGKWSIYVTAKQGDIVQTKTFEKDIRFNGLNPISLIVFSVSIILVSLLLAFIALRTLRSIKRKQLEEQRAKDEAEAERIAEAARVAELERQLAEMQAALAKPKPRRKPATKAKTKPETD
jgi:hypothetical protein